MTATDASPKYRRVLLKISGEVLMGGSPFGIDLETVDAVAREVAAIHATGTYRNGVTASSEVDVVAAYNAVNTPVLGTDVGWTPVLHGAIEVTATVPVSVVQGAGPFK